AYISITGTGYVPPRWTIGGVGWLPDLDVAEGRFRGVDVDLPGDDTVLLHPGDIGIDGGFAIELHRDVLADALHEIVVEVVGLDLGELLLGRPHLGDGGHVGDELGGQAAPVLLANVGLRAGDVKPFPVEDVAAEIETTVGTPAGAFDAHLELDLKVL